VDQVKGRLLREGREGGPKLPIFLLGSASVITDKMGATAWEA